MFFTKIFINIDGEENFKFSYSWGQRTPGDKRGFTELGMARGNTNRKDDVDRKATLTRNFDNSTFSSHVMASM